MCAAKAESGVVRLHGKEYFTVARRVQDFRQLHPIKDGWGIITDCVSVTDQSVLFKASIIDPSGRVLATGYAEERRSSRGINSTSALEACETSAIGRALAAAGMGGGGEYCSADELVSALKQQTNQRKSLPSWFVSKLVTKGISKDTLQKYCNLRGWKPLHLWSNDDLSRMLSDIDSGAHEELIAMGGK